MLNVKRARYTDKQLYRYYLHDASISNRKRTGLRNVEYQRHYLKIAQMLESINSRYRHKVKIYPAFHYQITYEALSVCTVSDANRTNQRTGDDCRYLRDPDTQTYAA